MSDGKLIKKPHQETAYTEEQIQEIYKCLCPDTGALHFLENYFWVQHPTLGRTQYKPYYYQVNLLNAYNNYRFSVNMIARQGGKTVTAVGYLLHYAMFNPDSTILIAANKFTSAMEIMHRVQYAYEEVPDFLRCGVISYNKSSIEFDNRSRIISSTTSPTTGRGMSISILYCLDGDTNITVRNKKTGKIENLSIEKFYEMNNGCNMFAENIDYEILTPTGWEDFHGISRTENKSTIKIILEDGNFVISTKGHYFFIDNKKMKAEDLKVNDFIDTKNGPIKIVEINEHSANSVVYDIINVDNNNHQFIVNDNIITKNCDELAFVPVNIATEFWSSIFPTLSTGGKAIITSTPSSDEDLFADIWRNANRCLDENGNETDTGINGFKAFRADWWEHPERDEEWAKREKAAVGEEKWMREYELQFIVADETLIDSRALLALQPTDILRKTGQIRWYDTPKKGKDYVVSLDPSLGTGGNYAAIQIFELPGMKQVGEWQNNKTPVQQQIKILQQICEIIAQEIDYDHKTDSPRIWYSVENNTLGEAALVVIDEIGEENIPGHFMSQTKSAYYGNSRVFRKGYNTTHKSKLTACSRLKNLVETDKMTIRSKNLISELKTFIAKNTSYAAKQGETDDLVSATLLMIRIAYDIKHGRPNWRNIYWIPKKK